MPTDYKLIFDKFIKKLKGDKQFFNYSSLTEEEINEIIENHMVSLLNSAIDRLYTVGHPDIDLYDKDDELQVINQKLIPQEISLLSELMYLSYLEEDINKLKALGAVFRTSEINVIASPANERKTTMDMIKDVEFKTMGSVSNYLSRNRKTWNFKSIYGDEI